MAAGAAGVGSGAALTGTSAMMANAAFASLVSTASISTINNSGDIGAVLKELGSEEYAKNLAFSVVTAGATQGVSDMAGLGDVANPNTMNSVGGANLTQRLNYSLIQSGVSAGADSVIYGNNFIDSFTDRLQSGSAMAVGSWASGVTASQFPNVQGGFTDTAIQAGIGCAAGSLGGGNCGAAAVGGAVGNIAGAYGVDSDIERIIGGAGVLLMGGDANDVYLGADMSESYAGVVNYTVQNVLTAPELNAQLMDGYIQFNNSAIGMATPWGANGYIEGYTGYTQTWLLGGDAAPKPNGVAVVNPNNNNIGTSRILGSNGNAPDVTLISEGGLMSDTLNVIPGFNNGSITHDMFVHRTQNDLGLHSMEQKLISNQGTTVPLIGYNYYGLIGKTLSPNIIESNKPSELINKQE